MSLPCADFHLTTQHQRGGGGHPIQKEACSHTPPRPEKRLDLSGPLGGGGAAFELNGF